MKQYTPYVTRNVMRRSFELRFLDHRTDGYIDAVIGVTCASLLETEPIDPALSLTPEQASALMDEMWAAGVRPTSVGSTGELQSVKYHLEDMRKLVFGKKGE